MVTPLRAIEARKSPIAQSKCILQIMKESTIQWCDDTVNLVMGCDGCELWPTISQILGELVNQISSLSALPRSEIRDNVESLFAKYKVSTELWHDIPELSRDLRKQYPTVSENIIRDTISKHFRCYAGHLHFRWAGRSTHDTPVNAGYPPVFERPTKFRGRMAKTAKNSDLRDTYRSKKPWLHGLPRLVFVSDMGDALSGGIDFEYLKTEIIDIVTSPEGRRHIWLWLTKRTARMAEFAEWLDANYNQPWPDNLVAMTSVTNKATRSRIDDLRRVPAMLRGLSVEPLVESVDLNLEGIDWLIVGGESGEYAREFDIEWTRSLREQCRTAGTAFFVKQLGAKPVEDGFPVSCSDSHGGNWDEWPRDLRIREFPKKFQFVTACVHHDPINSHRNERAH